MREKIAFLRLCWKAYNGDPVAAIDALKVLKVKAEKLTRKT